MIIINEIIAGDCKPTRYGDCRFTIYNVINIICSYLCLVIHHRNSREYSAGYLVECREEMFVDQKDLDLHVKQLRIVTKTIGRLLDTMHAIVDGLIYSDVQCFTLAI